AWRRQAGAGIPHRSSFTPRAVQPFVGNLTIFERTEPHRYRVRLMGTRVAGIIGDMQGKFVHEALPRDTARRWTIALDQVLFALRPARFVNTVAFNNLDYLEAEILLAPLLDEHDRPSMVYVVTAFRSGVAAAPGVDQMLSAVKSSGYRS
ncbi:MAG: PAS domain-containing protein, partial [Alphaproteobacteria bacterium]|nr:PAS domain-containing protein [Alphaproteobacteria bacterium]